MIKQGIPQVERKLAFIQAVQAAYPNAVVLGGLALFLRGLKYTHRDITQGDIDLAVLGFDPNNPSLAEYQRAAGVCLEAASGADDFAERFELRLPSLGAYCIKVDISNKSLPYDEFTHDGHVYRVATLANVLGYKAKYALRGIDKHRVDLADLLERKAVKESDFLIL